MIKLLYVYIGAGKRHSSVKDKVVRVINQFNRLGVKAEGKFFTTEVTQIEKLDENIELFPVEKTSSKYFRSWYQHKNNVNAVFDFVKKNSNHFDVIFFRYPGANLELYKGMKEHGHKIMFEHNSKELMELELHNRQVKFGLSPSKFLTWYQNKKLLFADEKKYGGKVLALAKMGLAVTDDIAQYEKNRANGSYHCETGPNGIEVEKVRFRDYIAFDGENLNIALISGANTAAPYLGVDRIIEGLKTYKGDVNLNLFCLGKIFLKEKELVDKLASIDRAKILGVLNGQELDVFFEDKHVSLGSMGLHRIEMTEGSVMKVNDSLSRGIPVVISYDDMELKSSNEFAPYILKVPANESAINFDDVVEFIRNLSKDKNHPEKIRATALKHSDLRHKIEKVIEKIVRGFDLEKNV